MNFASFKSFHVFARTLPWNHPKIRIKVYTRSDHQVFFYSFKISSNSLQILQCLNAVENERFFFFNYFKTACETVSAIKNRFKISIVPTSTLFISKLPESFVSLEKQDWFEFGTHENNQPTIKKDLLVIFDWRIESKC